MQYPCRPRACRSARQEPPASRTGRLRTEYCIALGEPLGAPPAARTKTSADVSRRARARGRRDQHAAALDAGPAGASRRPALEPPEYRALGLLLAPARRARGRENGCVHAVRRGGVLDGTQLRPRSKPSIRDARRAALAASRRRACLHNAAAFVPRALTDARPRRILRMSEVGWARAGVSRARRLGQGASPHGRCTTPAPRLPRLPRHTSELRARRSPSSSARPGLPTPSQRGSSSAPVSGGAQARALRAAAPSRAPRSSTWTWVATSASARGCPARTHPRTLVRDGTSWGSAPRTRCWHRGSQREKRVRQPPSIIHSEPAAFSCELRQQNAHTMNSVRADK